MEIAPGTLSGTVCIPPSKSVGHRAILCAALARGTSRIGDPGVNQDIAVTLSAVAALGAKVDRQGDTVEIAGIEHLPCAAEIDCGESGSALRFLIPVACALGVSASFRGRGKLPERPISPLTDVLARHGIAVAKNAGEIVSVSGKLLPGRYEIAGNVSSQYITGLLYALPLLPDGSEILLTTPLESGGYVDITLQVLRDFGIHIEETGCGYRVPGGQRYRARQYRVEGDYSAAAFWLCANALGSDVRVSGLSEDSRQGDREIIAILDTLRRDADMPSVSVDVSQVPDLLPALAAVAAHRKGETVFTGAGRLRAKESDRLAAMASGIRALGGLAEEGADFLAVRGGAELPGGTAESFNDHRIAMALSICALGCKGKSVIGGAQCARKSYPGFYRDFAALGGACNVIGVGD